MDESGHSGDAGAAEGGNSADAHERTRANGWATQDSPWSHAGVPLDPDAEVPAWRRPTPFPRNQAFPPVDRQYAPVQPAPAPPLPNQPASAVPAPAPAPAPPGFVDAGQSGEIPSSVGAEATPRWADARPRYSDLLAHLSPPGGEQARPPAPRIEPGADGTEPGLGSRSGRPTSLRAYDAPAPNSAPPFPYEGDLDETPARPEWAPAPTSPGQPPRPPANAADEPKPLRPSYDPSSFPRRLSYEPPYEPPPAAEPTGYVPPGPYGSFGGRPGEAVSGPADPGSRVLPQRVPAQPDVPRVPEPPLSEPTAETPALARIATHLRRGDVRPRAREEGFDVQAILAAVRGVDGVRDASLRATPQGAHSLRLDLAEGADPAEVSRRVARLLQDRMGLDAAMKGDSPLPPAPVSPPPMPVRQRTAPPPAPAPVSPAHQAPEPPVERPRPTPVPEQRQRPVERPVEPPPRVEPEPAETAETAAVIPAETATAVPRPLYLGEQPGPRIVIENVRVNTFGTDASVEVTLGVGGHSASGVASGPAVDGYLLRLCATATAGAVDELLATSDHPDGPARCFVEHAAAVPFGSTQVAVVVLLLSCNGWVEQLAGSAVVSGDDRHAMVRATLAAVNRRLEALLSQ